MLASNPKLFISKLKWRYDFFYPLDWQSRSGNMAIRAMSAQGGYDINETVDSVFRVIENLQFGTSITNVAAYRCLFEKQTFPFGLQVVFINPLNIESKILLLLSITGGSRDNLTNIVTLNATFVGIQFINVPKDITIGRIFDFQTTPWIVVIDKSEQIQDI